MRLRLTRARGYHSPFRGIALLLLAAIAACKDDPGPKGAISITLERSSLNIPQARSDSVIVYLTRVNGYASNVALAVDGLPAGVTHSFSSASVTSGTPHSILYLAVGANASAGTYPLTIRARGSGVDEQAANVQLTIVANPPTLALAISPTVRAVPPGQIGTATVTITRGGTFVAPVDLTAESVPANVAVTFSPATIPAGAVTSSVTLTVDASAAHGQHAITIRARGEGVADQLATLVLRIETVGIAIVASPAVVEAQAGAAASVALHISRTGGFTGSVMLALEHVPNGITATFAVNPVAQQASRLALTIGSNVAPGDYTVTIRGSSAGVGDAVTTVTIRVTAGGPAGNVTFRFCSADSRPLWLAAQDDAGPWVRIPASPNDSYSFNIAARGGVAIVRQRGTGFELQVIYATAAELADAGLRWDFSCSAVTGPKQLTGTLAGLAGQEPNVRLGPRSAIINESQGTYTLRNVPNGALDLVAARGVGDPLTFDINRLIIRRGLDLPDGSVIPVLDFAGSEAVATIPSTLTLSDAGTDELSWIITYLTASGTEQLLNASFFESGVSAISYGGVPSSVQQPGDVHWAFMVAEGASDLRFVSTGFHSAQPRTLTIGPRLAVASTQVVSSAPYARYRMVLPAQAEYPGMAAGFFNQPTHARETEIFVTAAYLGGTPSQWEIVVPDLTAAAGFDPQWGLRPGVATQLDPHARSYGLLLPPPRDGETMRTATRFESAPTTPARVRRPGASGRDRLEWLRTTRRMGVTNVHE